MTTHDATLRTLSDRLEIEGLSTRFSRALDGGDAEMFLSIFTEDVDYRSGGRELSGHDDLRAFFEARAAGGRLTRHMMTGLDVRFDGADAATGESCWLVFAGEMPAPADGTTPYLVADVADDYVRTATGWRIARRHISPVFKDAGAPGPQTSK